MQPTEQAAAGWYPDPWALAAWRWFDGRDWSGHVHGVPVQPPPPTAEAVAAAQVETVRKPRLPAWLSPPVLAASVIAVPGLAWLGFQSPISLLLVLVPILIVLPVLVWLDRVEPEPWPSRIHAFLWGATVAAVVSGVVNTIAAVAVSEGFATVVSAPVVEETAKVLGIVWALRRREIDGIMDGVTYAGWVALGFAVVEDVLYFAISDTEDLLLFTFIARALLSPFAHPLFTGFAGLAIGLAVYRQQPVWRHLLWGLPLAIGFHAAWNGSLALAQEFGDENGALVLVGAAFGFFVVFLSGSVALLVARKREQRAYAALVPSLAAKYGLSARETIALGTWRQARLVRRTLAPADRKGFDRVHLAMTRLALLHRRVGEIDPVDEARLSHQLAVARGEGPTLP